MAESNTLQELLKSGAHFGHLTRRWNPKMSDFIFMERNGIHIIDLKKTVKYLEESLDAVRKMARAGKTILFVGTKKQAQDIVKTEAIRCGMPYVTHRWLGGMMTNFSTVRRSIKRMQEIEQMRNDGTFDELTKKERLMLEREHDKLENTLGGIAGMNRLPGAVFIVDTIKENIAVNEAVKLHIPIVAMADTNSDPDIPDYIVPCNDDSARTIQLITSKIADAVIEGTAEREAQNEEELLQQAAKDAEKAEKEAKKEEKEEKKTTKRRSRRKSKSKSKDKDKDKDKDKKDDKKKSEAKAKDTDSDKAKASEDKGGADSDDDGNDEEE
jgi:small subunit ribosomal protein S2